jgi:hypothetical protein
VEPPARVLLPAPVEVEVDEQVEVEVAAGSLQGNMWSEW